MCLVYTDAPRSPARNGGPDQMNQGESGAPAATCGLARGTAGTSPTNSHGWPPHPASIISPFVTYNSTERGDGQLRGNSAAWEGTYAAADDPPRRSESVARAHRRSRLGGNRPTARR